MMDADNYCGDCAKDITECTCSHEGALMNTEDKIREAFTKSFPNDCYPVASFTLFRAGYMALLNELEFTRLLNADGKLMMTYNLPEGVTKL